MTKRQIKKRSTTWPEWNLRGNPTQEELLKVFKGINEDSIHHAIMIGKCLGLMFPDIHSRDSFDELESRLLTNIELFKQHKTEILIEKDPKIMAQLRALHQLLKD